MLELLKRKGKYHVKSVLEGPAQKMYTFYYETITKSLNMKAEKARNLRLSLAIIRTKCCRIPLALKALRYEFKKQDYYALGRVLYCC